MRHRWTDLDTDDYRLPEGFTRVGYDSNTRRYQFRDAEGRMYQGEPGEEFGGRLTSVDAIDPSMRHRFAPEDDGECNLADSPRNSSEGGNRRLVSTAPARQTTRPNQQSPSSFADFLSDNQMGAATSPEPPEKKPANRRLTSSLRRVGTLVRFRSAKTKRRAATVPNSPAANADEWGIGEF